jgi:hypothetical protein
LILDDVIKYCKEKIKPYNVGHWKMKKVNISELCYADDMFIAAENEKDLQHNINIYNKEMKKKNLIINRGKTKTIIINGKEEQHKLKVDNTELEQVESYKYLGVIINKTGNLEAEILERTGKTGKLFNAIRTTFLGNKEIPKEVKVEVVKKVALPILTYASETWTTTENIRSKVRSLEMRFLRKIQGKSRKDRIRNETYRTILKSKPVEQLIQE